VTTQKENRGAILALAKHGKTPTEISCDLAVSRESVHRTLKRGTTETPRRVKKRPARPLETIEAVKNTIDDIEGKTSLKGLAREFDMQRTTMRRLAKEDLGMNCYKRTPRQALKPIDHEKRLAGAKRCLNLLKKKPAGFAILQPFPLVKW